VLSPIVLRCTLPFGASLTPATIDQKWKFGNVGAGHSQHNGRVGALVLVDFRGVSTLQQSKLQSVFICENGFDAIIYSWRGW
jgi:hypothetical protein